MNRYLTTAKTYIIDHKKEFKAGAIAALVMLLVGGLVALFVYNSREKLPDIVYQPVKACDLFTLEVAHELLGKDVLNNVTDPSVSGNTATSKCSYTDTNKEGLTVAAVAVRTGINDTGVLENHDDFAALQQANETESVKDTGEQAYFIPSIGQLNILYGYSWITVTYGKGDDLSKFRLEDALKLAHKILDV